MQTLFLAGHKCDLFGQHSITLTMKKEPALHFDERRLHHAEDFWLWLGVKQLKATAPRQMLSALDTHQWHVDE